MYAKLGRGVKELDGIDGPAEGSPPTGDGTETYPSDSQQDASSSAKPPRSAAIEPESNLGLSRNVSGTVRPSAVHRFGTFQGGRLSLASAASTGGAAREESPRTRPPLGCRSSPRSQAQVAEGVRRERARPWPAARTSGGLSYRAHPVRSARGVVARTSRGASAPFLGLSRTGPGTPHPPAWSSS